MILMPPKKRCLAKKAKMCKMSFLLVRTALKNGE
jgi:hypothetical protein